jgi:hypothetical protein
MANPWRDAAAVADAATEPAEAAAADVVMAPAVAVVVAAAAMVAAAVAAAAMAGAAATVAVVAMVAAAGAAYNDVNRGRSRVVTPVTGRRRWMRRITRSAQEGSRSCR